MDEHFEHISFNCNKNFILKYFYLLLITDLRNYQSECPEIYKTGAILPLINRASKIKCPTVDYARIQNKYISFSGLKKKTFIVYLSIYLFIQILTTES